jgi:hypothetical protein
MKTICTFILMGLLALAPCKAAIYPIVPTLSLPCSTEPELTETRVKTLITSARPQLESQTSHTYTVEFLYQEYLDGELQISYMGYDGVKHVYELHYEGGVGISGLDNF